MAPGDDPARELREYGEAGAQRLVLTVRALEPGGDERDLEGLARAYLRRGLCDIQSVVNSPIL